MAYVEMQVAPAEEGGLKSKAFEYEGSLAAAGNGDSILIPDDIRIITVQVEPTTCTVKVQTTIDKVATIKAGTETWVDWDLGEVSVNTQDSCDPVAALRLVQVGAGSSKIKVRVQ